MEKDNLQNQIINKIKNRSETLKLFLSCYNETEEFDLYIYDLIAYVLNAHMQDNKKPMTKDVECCFLSLFGNMNSENEIKVKITDLSKIIKIIDDYNFSNNIFDLLKRLFIYNEMYIDCDYKLNTINLSRAERNKIKNDCRDIKREMKGIIEYFYLYVFKKNIINKSETYIYSVKKILQDKKINLNKYNYPAWNKKENPQEEVIEIKEKPKKTK